MEIKNADFDVFGRFQKFCNLFFEQFPDLIKEVHIENDPTSAYKLKQVCRPLKDPLIKEMMTYFLFPLEEKK